MKYNINYKMIKKILIPLISIVGLVSAAPECRFAKDYTQEELLTDSRLLNNFLNQTMQFEARFVREIGVDKKSGLTYDG